VTESAGGFVLPNGARRVPDAAWTLKSRVRALDPAMINRYWHLCPDFVIELRSPTGRVRTLREKMCEWVDNGAQLAWLIDPETRTAEICRPNREPEGSGKSRVPHGRRSCRRLCPDFADRLGSPGLLNNGPAPVNLSWRGMRSAANHARHDIIGTSRPHARLDR